MEKPERADKVAGQRRKRENADADDDRDLYLVLPRTIGNRPIAMGVMTSKGDRNAMVAIDPSTISDCAPTLRRVVRSTPGEISRCP